MRTLATRRERRVGTVRTARAAAITTLLVSSVASVAIAGALAACSDTPSTAADSGADTAPTAPVPDSAPVVDAATPDAPDAADAADAAGPCDDKGPDGLVRSLACTGLYADLAAKTLAPGVTLYVPGTPFWSDGAEKERYLLLPPGQKIDTSDMDAWKWPVGTKVWKQFKLGGKRIETRHYAKIADGKWARTTYRWDAGETRAVRLDTGETLGDGYEIPTLQKCDTCHYGGRDQLLGLDAISLSLPGASGVTLAGLASAGALTAPPTKTSAVVPEDASGKARAALQWLHANCSSCHSDAPLAGASAVNLRLALKSSELLSAAPTPVTGLAMYTTAYCTDTRYVPADAGAPLKAIQGGDKALSAIYARANVREPTGRVQMPPIGSHKIDTVGLGAVGAWLDTLPPCP